MAESTQAVIRLPEDVKTIISALETAGHEAYAVGGCVRDSILGRTPEDWDITTSAKPVDIKSVFRRTVDTGIEHGTVTVLLGDRAYEVTTYRVDGEYRDLRHPAEVTFTSSLREDLQRRDFTINAMAYSESAGLVDLYGGRRDLEDRLVRCVGAPDDRFNEDALRILRAVRFAAQLDFGIENETREAVKRHAANLSAVSKERILTEVSKLICSAHMEKAAVLEELGLAPYIAEHFSGIDFAHITALKDSAGTEAMTALWENAKELSAWTRPEASSGPAAGADGGELHNEDYDSHVCLAEPDAAVAEHNEKHAHGHTLERVVNAPQPGGSVSAPREGHGSLGSGTRGAPGDQKAAGQPPMNNIFALFGLPPTKAAKETESEQTVAEDTRSLFRAYDLQAEVSQDKRYIRFAFLLQGMDPASARALLKSLKADNVTLKQGVLLSELSLKPLPEDRYLLKKQMADMKPELFRDLLYVKLASSLTDKYRTACPEEDIEKVLALFEDIREMGEPVYLSDLVLSGAELKALGAPEGPEIGEILNRMLDAAQRDPRLNTILYLISNYYHRKP